MGINIHSQTIYCFFVSSKQVGPFLDAVSCHSSWQSYKVSLHLRVLAEGLVIISMEFTVEIHLSGHWSSGSPIIWPFGKFVENSTKLTCLEITCYRIKYSTMLWLLELQIRRGRKVETKALTVNGNGRTSNCQCSLISKKNPIIWIFWISGWLDIPK